MKYFAVSTGREIKARKIESVLCDYLGTPRIENKKVLDLGSGSGHIAGYFAQANEVIAADVADQIAPENAAVQFRKIDSALLPFGDALFDIVIFNHVICCTRDQYGQLREIYRVLRDGGLCYMATANRYFPVEGFTGLPLIHYFPNRLFRSLYKKMRRTDDDLFPVGYHTLVRLIEKAGFDYREYTAEILRNPVKYHSEYRMPLPLPVPQCISPTVVFILKKQA